MINKICFTVWRGLISGDVCRYLILLYFRGTLISRKFSRYISRVFNFAIAEKNCVCREFNFAKLTIK